ncbi:MAG: hypothetical protein J5706_06775 [Elusimicrobiales bacterium]|nr:hypothetical protein [Elusimicrobiales bacterium]
MKLSFFEQFFEKADLDIRKNKNNPRFLDQKCTPDVLSFIADCVLQSGKESFTWKDIWKSSYFVKNASFIFGKPSPENENTKNEYDKFISQPLDLLAYSGVISKNKKGQHNIFHIESKEMLEAVSINEKKAFDFLYAYFHKFAKDSGIFPYIEKFFEFQDRESLEILKTRFIRLVYSNSNIGTRRSKTNGEVEIRRIFPKFLNVFSVYANKRGIEKGKISKHGFIFPDLMYNRVNFRDVRKMKNITRREQKMSKFSSTEKYFDFQMQKAMRWVRQHHPYSEIKDKLYGKTDAVHHIFPKSLFPEISYYVENLIALTAGQHLSLAHPHGDTKRIDPDYQRKCLHAKKETIKVYAERGKTDYSLPNFIYVLSIGFDGKMNIPVNSDFSQIGDMIDSFYKQI